MRELFIYYRMAAVNVAEALTLALAAQARLRERHAGLSTRLLRRPDAENGLQTWMETYAFDALAADAARANTASIEADIERELTSVLAPWLVGARHVEVFIPCA